MISPCIILWRNTQNGKVGFIGHEDPDVFASEQEAKVFAENSPLLRAFPYQIVELEL